MTVHITGGCHVRIADISSNLAYRERWFMSKPMNYTCIFHTNLEVNLDRPAAVLSIRTVSITDNSTDLNESKDRIIPTVLL